MKEYVFGVSLTCIIVVEDVDEQRAREWLKENLHGLAIAVGARSEMVQVELLIEGEPDLLDVVAL